jgi:fructokinase
MSPKLRIGIDLGGTKIEGVALDDGGTIRARHRVPTPAGDYRGMIDAIRSMVETIEAAIGSPASVGVGTPGAISPATGLVKNSNSTCLNGRPLQQDLEAALGRPVRLANDANCFTLSEAADGAAARYQSVFGVILGTGVGGGIAIGGRIVAGANAIAGEWGHNPLPWPEANEIPGPPCYCGRAGCVETFLSGPALRADHRCHSHQDLDPAEIVRAAERGERCAAASFARYVDRLARGLAMVINLIDPDAIVLGGGLSQIEALYREVPRRWGYYVFSDRVDTRLLAPRHGDASGVRGAAWLWPLELRQ